MIAYSLLFMTGFLFLIVFCLIQVVNSLSPPAEQPDEAWPFDRQELRSEEDVFFEPRPAAWDHEPDKIQTGQAQLKTRSRNDLT